MNKIYRVVWNTESGQWIVASEMAKGRKKASSGAKVGALAVMAAAAAAGSPSAFAATSGEAGLEICQNGTNVGINTSVCALSQDGWGLFTKFGTGFTPSEPAYITGTQDGVMKIWASTSINVLNDLTMSNKKIMSLAKGTAGTDAVNVSQLNAVAETFGAGAGIDASGNMVAPSYALTEANSINGTTGAATDVGVAFGKVDDALGALDSRVSTNTTAITNIMNGGGIKYFHANSTGADSSATGVEAIAIGGGATSSGTASTIAMGQNASSAGASTIALGQSSSASGSAGIAIGQRAAIIAGANNAIALGGDSKADDKSVAIGNGADTTGGSWATAMGTNAKATGTQASAFGGASTASANYATAVGISSTASAANAVALGASANASAANSVALGAASKTTANLTTAGYNPGSAALSGTASAANGEVSIGSATKERRLTNLAAGSAATDAVNVSQLQAEDATVDKQGTDTAAALGGGATYNATIGAISAPSYALTKANAINGTTGAATDVGTAFGKVDTALGALDGRVTTLAANPLTFSGNSGTDVSRKLGDTLAIKGVASTAGTFSGNNIKTVADATTGAINIQMADSPKFGNVVVNDSGKISGLADGTAASDAATKGQLDTAVASAGKWKLTANSGTAKTITSADTVNLVDGKNTKASFDATTNQLKVDVVDAPTFAGQVTAKAGLDMSSTKITNVADGTLSAASKDAVNGSQLYATNQAVTNVNNTVNNITNGGGIKYFHANSTAADSTTTGSESIAIGGAAQAVGAASIALGSNAQNVAGSNNSIAIGGSAKSSDKSVTIGNGADTSTQVWSTAVGTNAKSTGQYGVALGAGTTASGDGSVALGTNSLADRANTVSVGKSGAERQVVNVAKGTALTDAVNVSQLKSVTDALGGGSTVNTDGTVKAPTYDVNGTTYNNVGGAVDALDSRIDGVAANPLKFSANSGTDVSRKLGDTLAIKGVASTTGTFSGNNIKTVADATTGAINIQIADSPKFGNIVINDSGKISGLADGTAAKDAVNKGQMDQAIADATGGVIGSTPLSFTGNSGAKVDRKLGQTLAIKGGAKTAGTYSDDNIKTVTDPTTGEIKVQMADAPKFGEITINDDGKISGLANGTAAGDAATFDQVKGLADVIGGDAKVDPTTGEVTKPTFDMGDGTTTSTVADAIENLGDRTEANSTVINNIINNGTGIKYFHANSKLADSQAKGVDSVAIGGNAIANGKYAVAIGANSKADRDNTVSVGDAGAERQIVNVKAGTAQTDAVNVSQLKAVTDAMGGGMAIDPTTGKVTPPTFNVTDADGNTVPAKTVADAFTTIDGRVSNIDESVTNIINGDVGMVQQDKDSRDLTVGKDTDGTVVNFTNVDGEARVLDGVANGEIKPDSKQAINGGQAYDIANSVTKALGGDSVVNPDGTISMPSYDVTKADGTTEKVDGVQGAIENLDGRVYQNTTDITNITNQINNGEMGLVKYDDATGVVSVAAAKGGTVVDFANVDGQARQLKNVAAGTEDKDAVNVKQLKDLLGGESTTDADGNYVGPTYNITNIDGATTSVTNVGDALYTIDGRVSNLYQQINQGSVGLVQQAAAGEELTVGKDTDGTAVNFANVNGDARTLSNVANGEVSEKSKDAVNGSQLYTVAQSVADGLGGGSTVNEDGSVSAPTYNVTNIDGTTSEVHNVGDAITNLDQRTVNNTTQIDNITNQINNGGIGLVQQATPGSDVTVAKDTGGKAVNFTGTDGDRVLSGIAAGSADNEAVNVKQLKDAGVIDPSGHAKSVVTYDNTDKTSLTLGGEGASAPVAIHNVADGVGDRDAVNVGQLNQRLADGNAQTLSQANAYTDQKFNDVWQNMGNAINEVNQQANRGIAAASALINVTPYVPGHTAVNAGVASYRGEAALGVGVSRWSDNGRVNLNAGVSASKGDQPVFRVGVGYVF